MTTSSGPPGWHPRPPRPVGAAGPERPTPPATVAVASVLLVIAAVLALLPLVSLVYDLTHFDDVLRRAAARTGAGRAEVGQERGAHRVITGAAVAFLLLTSAALAVPVPWVRRGRPVARAVSCVAGVGAALCCCAGYGLSVAVRGSPGASDLQSEVSRLSAAETPVWVGLVALPSVLVAPLAMTAAVLLLVPQSNRFFRPPAPPAGQPYGGYYFYPGPPTSPPDRPDQPPDSAPHE